MFVQTGDRGRVADRAWARAGALYAQTAIRSDILESWGKRCG